MRKVSLKSVVRKFRKEYPLVMSVVERIQLEALRKASNWYKQENHFLTREMFHCEVPSLERLTKCPETGLYIHRFLGKIHSVGEYR